MNTNQSVPVAVPKPWQTKPWLICFVLLASFFPAVFLQPNSIDPDAFWHLRVAEEFVEKGELPETDSLSDYGRRYHVRWIAYSWLFELPLLKFHNLFAEDRLDMRGLYIFKIVLNTITLCFFFAFLIHLNGWNWATCLVFGVCCVPFSLLLSERPWHATICGTLYTLAVINSLHRHHKFERWHFSLIPVFVIWANIHIQFVLGIALLGLAVIHARWEGKNNTRRYFMMCVLCTLATLVNPYHFELWRVVYEYATQTAPLRNIAEAMPPDFQDYREKIFLVLAIAAFVHLAYKRFPTWETGLFVVGTFFAFRMRRDLWFGTICYASIFLMAGKPVILAGRKRQALEALTSLVVSLGVAAGALAALQWKQNLEGLPLKQFLVRTYPVAAVEFLQKNYPNQRGYNTFEWGGFLAWSWPENAVSIDGRTNLYGNERMKVYFWGVQGGDLWQADIRAVNPKWVIVPVSTEKMPFPLTNKLEENPDAWEEVYADNVAKIFKSKI